MIGLIINIIHALRGDLMYKVLIVEDEILVRNGIINSIKWDKFDMQVIGEASNGKDAWEIYQNELPDLVITDIKMPIMSGMELIAKIREQDKLTQIVILSCLEEFDLVKSAMRLGVCDYILKLTMTFAEMEQVLLKVKDKLNHSKGKNHNHNQEDKDTIFLKENLFKGFLFYNFHKDEDFQRQLKELDCRINPARLVVCVMEIDEYNKLKGVFKDEKGGLIRFSLLNMINEVLDSYGRGEVFQDDQRRFIIIFSFNDISNDYKVSAEINKIFEHLMRVFRSFFNVNVSFGASEINDGYKSLRKGYENALKAIELKFFYGQSAIIYSKEINYEGLYKDVIEKMNLQLDGAVSQKLIENEQAMKLKTIFKEQMVNKRVEKKAVLRELCKLLDVIPIMFNMSDVSVSSILMEFIKRIDEADTYKQSLIVFEEYMRELKKLDSKLHNYSREIVESIKFIKQNYKENISLQQVANEVCISPNYLSSLFKKELNVNFVDVLNQVRLEEAKKLLRDTPMKSYRVAEEVGFSHDSYFNRLFKKVVGMTPNEYRRGHV